MEEHPITTTSMFSQGNRPSFSLNIERPSSSRGRNLQAHLPKVSMSKPKTRPTTDNTSRTNLISTTTSGPAKRFITKGGKKHHAYDPEVAPYPFSYDRKTVDIDVLDHVFVMQARKSNVTWVDFKDGPPKRSLDLGCGVMWVLDAAKQWKECHFVGFDLVPIQPNLDHLNKPELAQRIQWVHGNFLGKLPFEDNTFDYVHACRLGWGIGEIHWDSLLEEIVRILKPGGAVEMGEEDILFPRLPRSYTVKTKSPRPAAPYPRPSLTLSPPPSPIDDDPDTNSHAYALLESLYFSVFESRMVNLRPTSILPHYMNIHFRHVFATPKFEYPWPPPPVSRQQLRHVPSDCTAKPSRRPTAESVSSLASTLSYCSNSDSVKYQQQQTPPTTNSSLSSLIECSLNAAANLQPQRPPMTKTMVASFGSISSCEPVGVQVLPPINVNFNERSLAAHLNIAYQRILGCKEAMWDELCKRLRLRRTGGLDQLHDLGWDDEDEDGGGDSSDEGYGGSSRGGSGGTSWGETRELERARTRFEELLGRFERDMRHRTALADVVEAALGWTKPAPAPLSKHERARETELEKAIAAAARAEEACEEKEQYSRAFKGFIGFKASQTTKR